MTITTNHVAREQVAGRATRRLGSAIVWSLVAWLAFIVLSGGAAFIGFFLAFGPGFLGVGAFAAGVILRRHGDAVILGESRRGGPALAWSTIAAGFFGFPAVYVSQWFSDERMTHRVPVLISQVMCAALALLALAAVARLLIANALRWPWFFAVAAAFTFDVILIRRPGSDQGSGTVLIALAIMVGVFWALKLVDWLTRPRDPRTEPASDPLASSVIRCGYGALLVLVIGITLPAWQTPGSPPWFLYLVLPISAALGIQSIRRAGRWRLANDSAIERARPVRRAIYAGIAAAAISGFFAFSYLLSLAR